MTRPPSRVVGHPEACLREMAQLGWAGGRRGKNFKTRERVLVRGGPWGRPRVAGGTARGAFGCPGRHPQWAATHAALHLCESRSGGCGRAGTWSERRQELGFGGAVLREQEDSLGSAD